MEINERISNQSKANFLLEKISLQLGASQIDKITIERIDTGKMQKIKIDDWIKFIKKNPERVKDYKTVPSDSTSN